MKTQGIVAAIACILCMVLTGCGSNVVLDNPSEEGAVFTFDGGEAYTVGPGQSMEISLAQGNHKVVIQRDKSGVYADTTISIKEGGIVHSGFSNYVIWRQLYGVQTDRKSLLNEDWIMVDSTRFFGDIKIYPRNGVYIEQNWTIGLADPLPETQALYVNKDFKVESKIYREQDFTKAYREMSEKNRPAK